MRARDWLSFRFFRQFLGRSTKCFIRGGVNSCLEFAYAVPTRLTAFIITTANDVPDRAPTAYRIEGFSAGSWQTLHVGGLALPTARLTDSALVTLPELPLKANPGRERICPPFPLSLLSSLGPPRRARTPPALAERQER